MADTNNEASIDANNQPTHVVRVRGINVNISPFAFQFFAKDFYTAYQEHKAGPPFSPARLYLLCHAIELAAKALHLHAGRQDKDLRLINHDLIACCDPNTLASHGIVLNPVEATELAKANEYYERKGLEYFLLKSIRGFPAGPELALRGWPGRPDEGVLDGIVNKLLTPRL